MRYGIVAGFACGLVLAFAAVALAQVAGVDAGSATGTTSLVGGLGAAGAAMSLVAWDKIKGEPARSKALIAALERQDESARSERQEMRATVTAELKAIHAEQSKLARAWVAMTGNPDVTSVVRAAMRDEG